MKLVSSLTAILQLVVATTEGARRVDARLRARETMKKRRETLIERRDAPELDTKELFGLTTGKQNTSNMALSTHLRELTMFVSC